MLKVLDPAVPVACWSCSVAHNESTLFCPHCSKIQPPPGGDYFSVFGLSRGSTSIWLRWKRNFIASAADCIPDRFARAAENEKEWSLADTALLNDAYRTLKDPITRTEYLLKLHGAEIGEEHSGARIAATREMGASRVPADLLEEVFDLNMQLEEMRMAHKMGEEDPALQAEPVRTAKKKIRRTAAMRWIRICARSGTVWDDGDEATRQTAQKTMVALLDRRRYLSNLVRDVTETLEGKNGAVLRRAGGKKARTDREIMAEGRVVGIDLGTTNSLVAYMEGDKPVVIPGVDGSNLVPSVVALDPIPAGGGRPTVTVGNSARKALIERPERVIYSVKRLMGRGLSEVQSELKLFPFRLGGRCGRRRGAAHPARRTALHAAGDFRLHSAPAQAQCGAVLRRAGDAGRHHRARLLQRRAAPGHQGCGPHGRASKCCAW